MSNLKSAKQAIQAELSHAREGAAFYQSRIVALEDALDKLDSVETVNGKAPKASRSKREAPAARHDKRGKVSRASAAGSATGGSGKLPSTGKGFWPGLITAEPQSASDILDAAIKTLGISPSKDQLKKLVQRQTNALHQLVKSKAIADSGSGRERRFFLPQ
jgi:hypothetical protein